MKKILAIILSALMVLSLFAGCGSSNKPAETAAPAAPAATEAPATEAAEASYMDELIAAAQA